MKPKKSIRKSITTLLLTSLSLSMLMTGGVSLFSLFTMKENFLKNSSSLGKTAAADAEKALEDMAGEQLSNLAVEKSVYIEEKFASILSYVHGIASMAERIYAFPENYPDRMTPLPVRGSTSLAPQLLWSQRHKSTDRTQQAELKKLSNIQDLLVEYNANSDMVSSTYVATVSGWMIQADYIAYSKYIPDREEPDFYEADTRQWYWQAMNAPRGKAVYSDIMVDIHEGGECIVCSQPIYKNGEVVAIAGVGSYLKTVKEAVLNTNIGNSGYAFLLNEKGQVIVSAAQQGETAAGAQKHRDLRKSKNSRLASAADEMAKGKAGLQRMTVDGREIYLAYAPLPELGWSFAVVMDVKEVISPARESQEKILSLTDSAGQQQRYFIAKTMLFFLAIAMAAAVLNGVVSTRITGKIIYPILRLTKDVKEIDGGNLDYRICIHTGDEVEELGNAFNAMTQKLREYITNLSRVTAERERIRTELEVASKLQADMLPDSARELKERSEFTLHAAMIPAKEVGGDFYDFFLVDEDHLAFLVADVSGKGVPAALFMVVAKTLIQSCAAQVMPAEAFQEVNEGLCKNNKEGMFVTAWMGVLALSTGILTYVNAGHTQPLLRHLKKGYQYVTQLSGFVLAGLDDTEYQQFQLQLEEGDTILLYSDGVTEANDMEGALYGEERLKTCLNKTPKADPGEVCSIVWQDVHRFQGEAEQFDDITMLALRYNGKQQENTGTASLERIREVSDFVEQRLTYAGFSESSLSKVLVAVDEIYSNICNYSQAAKVTVSCKLLKDEIRISFCDDGIPYNPLDQKEPDIEQTLEERKMGGLGIFLVKKTMDEVLYEYLAVEGKNKLTIIKKIN